MPRAGREACTPSRKTRGLVRKDTHRNDQKEGEERKEGRREGEERRGGRREARPGKSSFPPPLSSDRRGADWCAVLTFMFLTSNYLLMQNCFQLN